MIVDKLIKQARDQIAKFKHTSRPTALALVNALEAAQERIEELKRKLVNERHIAIGWMYAEQERSNTKLMEELKRKLVIKELKRKLVNERHIAIGWMHAEACSMLDQGKDPRTADIPEIIERAKRDFRKAREEK